MTRQEVWEEGWWNGLPTKVRKVSGVVREWQEDDPPQAWWRFLIGVRVWAVEVILDGVNYGGGRTFLYDEDGEGWHKVTEGRGSPRWSHRNVPLIEVANR